eukprot:scaffold707_cov399-Prasinococcus_capsulatus_cf.AAC.16
MPTDTSFLVHLAHLADSPEVKRRIQEIGGCSSKRMGLGGEISKRAFCGEVLQAYLLLRSSLCLPSVPLCGCQHILLDPENRPVLADKVTSICDRPQTDLKAPYRYVRRVESEDCVVPVNFLPESLKQHDSSTGHHCACVIADAVKDVVLGQILPKRPAEGSYAPKVVGKNFPGPSPPVLIEGHWQL